MIVVPMQDHHVLAIRPQAAQAMDAGDPVIRLEQAKALQASGPAWAVVGEAGVLALGGVAEMWSGRGMAWVVLSQDAGRHMLALTRLVDRTLRALDYRRLEMYVDAQFAEGCRWARVLGFTNETPEGMVGFLPNGNRAFMYGRSR